MSLPILVAQQKGTLGLEVTISLAILYLVELYLHPSLCPRYSLFQC